MLKKLSRIKKNNLEIHFSSLKRTLEEIKKDIMTVEKEIQFLETNDIVPPILIETNGNNCFVHKYCMCDYCGGTFDWGHEEIHYYDQDGKDLCVNCVNRFDPEVVKKAIKKWEIK
jgi:hypothetical protein